MAKKYKDISGSNPKVGAKFLAEESLKDKTKYFLPRLGYSFTLETISIEEVNAIQADKKFKDVYFIAKSEAAKNEDPPKQKKQI